MITLTIELPKPHAHQQAFIGSPAKRKVIRAGRRSGKTVGVGIYAVQMFLKGKRVLYATPTTEQIGMFWRTVKGVLRPPIDAGVFYKNESEHVIELAGSEQRIKAKTAWNADTLRGDYADLLILDEWQLMDEEAWETVGAPMLLDNDGDAVFVYTPPSLHSRSTMKAKDPQHAAKLFRRALEDRSGRWATFHFRSGDNPHISPEALAEISSDMSALAYRQEVLAEDVDEAPGALWTRDVIEAGRVLKADDMERLVIGLDPSATATGDEAGIVAAGRRRNRFFVLEDASLQAAPLGWAMAAVTLYHKLKADAIIAEVNNGGEMVAQTIATVDSTVNVRMVSATRGKYLRAEPVSAIYAQKRGCHVGSFPLLEDEMCLWTPGEKSPNRLDAMVWAATDLMLGQKNDVSDDSYLPAEQEGRSRRERARRRFKENDDGYRE